MNKRRDELCVMIAMGLHYEGIRKWLINYTNGSIENITKITWMLGIGGTLSMGGTVTVPHRVKCNIMEWLPNL